MQELYLHVVAYITNNFNRKPKIKFTLTLSKKKIDTENYFGVLCKAIGLPEMKLIFI